MRPHQPAGDMGDDRKATRKDIVDLETRLGEQIDAQADKILKKPKKELAASVRAIQGGQWESNRRKF